MSESRREAEREAVAQALSGRTYPLATDFDKAREILAALDAARREKQTETSDE